MNRFSQPPKNWDEVLSLILQCDQGLTYLQSLEKLIYENKLQILDYPHAIKTKLSENHLGYPLVSATFVTDGETGQIYLDLSCPLGLFVCLFYHEVIHATDESLWQAASSTAISAGTKSKLLFESECKAYREQHQLILKLKSLYPEFEKYLEKNYREVPFLNRELTRDEIAQSYQSAYDLGAPARNLA